MNEENKSATDLNNKMEIEQKIEQAKTEVLDLQQKLIVHYNFKKIQQYYLFQTELTLFH